MNKIENSFDKDQNWWVLTSIQTASLSAPGIFAGQILAKTYGIGPALTSIWIGNLILWVIGFTITEMSSEGRKNAVQNVKNFLGKPGAFFASILLMLGFIIWFTYQLRYAASNLTLLLEIKTKWSADYSLRIGAALGVLITLVTINGIRAIKWFSIYLLPFLFFYLIYAIIRAGGFSLEIQSWTPSPQGILLIVSNLLVGMVNLPTFFRHAKSNDHEVVALSLTIVIIALFQSLGIFVLHNYNLNFFTNPLLAISNLHWILTFSFVLLATICVNMMNIYYVSAAWELIIKRISGSKEYVIVGLVGTAAFTLLQISGPMTFLENLTFNFLAILGVMLIANYVIRVTVNFRPTTLKKAFSFSCWIAGCLYALYIQIIDPTHTYHSMIYGIRASTIAFVIFLFLSESYLSGKKIYKHTFPTKP